MEKYVNMVKHSFNYLFQLQVIQRELLLIVMEILMYQIQQIKQFFQNH